MRKTENQDFQYSKSTENLRYKDIKSRNIRELSVPDSQSIFGFFVNLPEIVKELSCAGSC